jgi:hypothetical protein
MKNIIKSLLVVGLLSFSSQAFAWTRLATCGTGDALEGMDVFTDGENVIVQILQYHEDPNGEGSVIANEYRTNNGMVNPVTINAVEVMEKLAKGETLTFSVTKEDSFSFGGVDSNAALLSLKLNPASQDHTNHYDRTSLLGFEGQVAHFFCY